MRRKEFRSQEKNKKIIPFILDSDYWILFI
jgi:hypothetical protein